MEKQSNTQHSVVLSPELAEAISDLRFIYSTGSDLRQELYQLYSLAINVDKRHPMHPKIMQEFHFTIHFLGELLSDLIDSEIGQ